ncbi:MAG: ABC transporter ATP-binding protein [Burkholderiaceae bacterium]|jgi:branched-chain amino acid transport system permease protein|nr:ABC transporter ATP-binding protein [Burkholderiaceae bacterium]
MIRSFFPGLSNNPVAAFAAAAGVGLVLLVLPLVAGELLGNFWVRLMAMALLYVMLALGLNIVVGFAGLLDLGYVAFYAVGAYMYALLASPHLAEQFEWIARLFPNGLHADIWMIVPLGVGIAALFGVLLGAPVLKLRGDYLAIVTLGFGEIIRIFLNNLNSPVNITNGPQGITGIDPIRIAGTPMPRSLELFGITFHRLHLYYYLFLVLAIAIIVISIRLQDSRIGRAWMAIREDEVAAKAMGINTRNVKLLAFAMGATFGGVAGSMFAAFQGFISPESFVLMESIQIVAMVVLGGMGHVPGVVLGAILLYGIPEALRIIAKPSQIFLFGEEIVPTEALRMLLFGGSMVAIMLIRPKGLWPPPRHGERAAPPGGAGGGDGSPGGGGGSDIPIARIQGGAPGPLAPERA